MKPDKEKTKKLIIDAIVAELTPAWEAAGLVVKPNSPLFLYPGYEITKGEQTGKSIRVSRLRVGTSFALCDAYFPDLLVPMARPDSLHIIQRFYIDCLNIRGIRKCLSDCPVRKKMKDELK